MKTTKSPLLTVIMVSYNTRELTLAALRTLFETTIETPIRVVVLDNASQDGSADAIEANFPEVELIRSGENLGFAKANNIVADAATTDWLLLLNPDTEAHPGAIDNLLKFAGETPEAGIWGGRTVFPDGRLNPASCYMKITPWSMICRTFGLYSAFSKSEFFNPEAIGDWQRDTVRHVDVVVGCFLLIKKELWHQLGGFDLKYFMYGEDADLCLRAARIGFRPMITPDAQIMHLYGASTKSHADKITAVAKARATLIRDHWPGWQVPLGLGLMWLGAAMRAVSSKSLAMLVGQKWNDRARIFLDVWQKRRNWLAGY